MAKLHWFDRLTAPLAPRWTLERARARVAGELLARHYEGASHGRRTAGWRRPASDANAAIGPGLAPLRNAVRDLVRNNPYAAAALASIVNETIGWGITAKSKNKAAETLWKKWAHSTQCDADGRNDIYGLQKLALRTVAESGEVLIRRRYRLPTDGLPIPMQLQVLEPDYLDATQDGITTPNGGRIIQGVEFSPIGQRVAYWMFRDHPGSSLATFGASQRIPADGVIHMFRGDRPGQVRAVSWFDNSLLRFKDLDDFEDATLIKQKIAACLAVMVTDADGLTSSLGDPDDTKSPAVDSLRPGMIQNLPPGKTITVVDPPRSTDYADYVDRNLRGISSGLRVLYESVTGDHTDLSFSAARMSRLSHQPDIDDWRWRLVIPQFCDRTWAWAMEAAAAANLLRLPANAAGGVELPPVMWSPPPLAFIDPAAEGLAILRNVRTGISTMPEELRARGLDPREVLDEIKEWNGQIDSAKIILDSDPRKMTQAGQAQTQAAPIDPARPGAPAAPALEEEDT